MKTGQQYQQTPMWCGGVNTRRTRGFTLIESVIAIALIALLLTTGMGALVYFMHTERTESVRNELDRDARALIERLKRDLWRSARNDILVYPPGSGPYLAISFPVVAGNQPISINPEGKIDWDATVIYHLKDGMPSEVRRTVFRPRMELSDEERLLQLSSVVANGDGSNTYNHQNAQTRTLITNPVEWELTINSSRFDAYAPESGRRKVRLGTALLQSGENDLTFEVVDKNPAHTGSSRHLGVDTLVVSPSGLPLEAEWQTVVQETSSHDPVVQNMGIGEVWSGNSRLWFNSSQTGDAFTLRINNDRWEERNFSGTGVQRHNLDRIFIEPDDRPHTFALQLQGNEIIWRATEQSRATSATHPTAGTGSAVRVFVRGADIVGSGWADFDGGWIDSNGTNVWATFRGFKRIESAFIAESLAPGSETEAMNYIPNTRVDFTFGGEPDVDVGNIWTGIAMVGSQTSDRAPFLIDKEKSYIVGLLISPYPGYTNIYPSRWDVVGATNGVPPSSFSIPGADLALFDEADWSGHPDLEEHLAILGVQLLRVGYAPEGTFFSPIIDTHTTNPDYEDFFWTATQPSNSVLTLKVRAGDLSDLSDAPTWEELPAAQMGHRPIMSGRYAQVKALFVPGDDALHTPRLEDFTLQWEGEQRYTDLSAIISTGPNHGVYRVLLNGAPLVQGVTAHVSVFKDAWLPGQSDRRLESSAFAEIVPRN